MKSLYIRLVTILILNFAACFSANAQSLNVFNLNLTGYPVVSSLIYARDASGKLIHNINAGDVNVVENGIPRNVTLLDCPPTKPPVVISLAMSLDVSGSMTSAEGGTVAPVELGKTTARNLVNAISDPVSDIALQTCNAFALIHQDFTTDRQKMLKAIDPIIAGGDNDFVEHLLNPSTGILNVAKKGSHQRVALLFTDAWWYALKPDELQRCKDTCAKYQITFFAVIYSRPEAEPNGIKMSLNQLAVSTGGRLIDGILTEQKAKDLANELQSEMQGDEACILKWESAESCNPDVTAFINIQKYNLSDTINYITPNNQLTILQVTPSTLNFGKVVPPGYLDKKVTLTAFNFPVTVSNITSNKPVFKILDGPPPDFTIPAGQSRDITVRFQPDDTNYIFGKININSTSCFPTFLYTNGGEIGSYPDFSLQLIKPNGGEEFQVGLDTTINWIGTQLADKVILEYSTNSGTDWQQITDTASGYSYKWKVPNTPSDKCLMRVKRSTESGYKILSGHTDIVSSLSWSPDGKNLVSGSFDNTLKIWDSQSGSEISTLLGHTGDVYTVSWSHDGSRIASGSYDNTIKIWDVASGTVSNTLNGHSKSVTCLAWSPDDSKIASVGLDGNIHIWDATTGKDMMAITEVSGPLWCVCWSPDGSRIAVGDNEGNLIIWDYTQMPIPLKVVKVHPTNIGAVSWASNGNFIATSSLSDNFVYIVETATYTVVDTLTGHTGCVLSVEWSPDSRYLATGSYDWNVMVWDASTYKSLKVLSGHTGPVHSIKWSPDGLRLASGAGDNNVIIWDLSVQYDVSDSLWSIIYPKASSKDLDMGKMLVDKTKDSVVKAFIVNTGNCPIRIDSVTITGPDAAQFVQVSAIPPIIIAKGEYQDVEFHFTPTSTGIKTALITIYTQSGVLYQDIRGEGIQPQLEITSNFIDFGDVEVGKTKDTVNVLLKNIGSSPINIESTGLLGPDIAQFKILEGGGSFQLNSNGDERTLKLEFAPLSPGRVSSQIGFSYMGVNSPAVSSLFGNGIAGKGEASLQAGTVSAHTGTIVEIPIYLINGINIGETGASGFFTTLKFNSTLLVPYSTTPHGSVDPITLERSILLELPPIPDSNKILAKFKFISTLGNADNTVLTLQDSRSIGGEVAINEFPGLFSLTNVCKQGGERLVKNSGKIYLSQNTPNPASVHAEIEYGLIENDWFEISLYNLFGEKIEILESGFKDPGIYYLDVNLSSLPAGTYFYMLRTNSQVLSQRMQVVK